MAMPHYRSRLDAIAEPRMDNRLSPDRVHAPSAKMAGHELVQAVVARALRAFAATGLPFPPASQPRRALQSGLRSAATLIPSHLSETPMPSKLLKLVACSAVFAVAAAHAHDGRAGDVEVTHPFATPTPAGARNAAAYVVTLENTGKQPDRLIRVSTRVAQRAEIHTMAVDAGGVMRMREVGEIALTPGVPVKMRPGEGYHFMLMGLKQPLKEGDSFPMTLEFEHGGKVEVKVVVQVPKARPGEIAEHKH
jgi:copper(I)-binding protein